MPVFGCRFVEKRWSKRTITEDGLKRVDGIVYLWYRTRIAIEFNFEFGLEKSNLMRRSFHGDDVINAL